MAWLRIGPTGDEQTAVDAERDAHPEARARRERLVPWLLHCRVTRVRAAERSGLGRATVPRYAAADRDGGSDGLRQWDVGGPVSDRAARTDAVRASLAETPVRTVAEACDPIAALTGARRRPTPVRRFPAGLGFRWRRARAVRVPPERASRTPSPAGGSSATGN